MFFMGITVIFLLFLIIIFLGVFLSKPKEGTPALIFNKPKVNIDMKIFDSEEFKNLQPLIEMQIQYSYKAATKTNKQQTGFIFAASEEEAKTILEDMGLKVSQLKETEIGRNNPFAAYYQITPPAAGTKTTTKK